MSKPFISNLIALGIIFFSFLETPFAEVSFSIGIFALSGGVTNWLAIHMLFEKIPFIFGSGVVELRFDEFKKAIKKLILEEFFNKENIEMIHNDIREEAINKVNTAFDKNQIFESFVQVIEASSFSKTLAMFGGTKILEPIKEPLVSKVEQILVEIIEKRELSEKDNIDKLRNDIVKIIDHKLNELSPRRVKVIIQGMIQQHLGWLVIWGAVFGGTIGLVFGIISK